MGFMGKRIGLYVNLVIFFKDYIIHAWFASRRTNRRW